MTVTFAGEEFLVPDTGLPDYDSERFWLVVQSVVIVVLFVVVLPVFMSQPAEKAKEEKGKEESSSEEAAAVKNKPTRGKKGANGKGKQKETETEPAPHDTEANNESSPERVEAPLIQLNLACLFCLIALVMKSSNNRLTARSSYVAPLFTPEECKFIIERAHEAARKNAENSPEDKKLQMSPVGWRKDRHATYPTTDLNVVTDPFTKEDRAFLAEKLNKRLAPLIERIYGINQAAIRANDMFVVRYDADEGQQRLDQHTDSSHVSFNVLLNDDFEGGGTRFTNRWNDEFYTAKPKVGQVLINNANMLHEGVETTKGTRFILVGFTSIDRFDPFTETSTDLSLFASWLSLPWVQVRMKQGTSARNSEGEAKAKNDNNQKKKIYDNKYGQSLFNDINVAFTLLGDYFSPHRVVTMVDPDNTRAPTEYLAALDASESEGKASWFRGQQIHVDVDGKITEFWDTRVENEAAFREL